MAPLTCIQSELLGPCFKTGLTTIVVKLYNRIREPALEDTRAQQRPQSIAET